MDLTLIEQIYDAAMVPERWPLILDAISQRVGAIGGVFMATSALGTRATVSPRLEDHLAAYIAEGWAADPVRTAPLLADQYPGFRAETDYRTVEEVEALPAHAEFLDRRGLVAGAATAIQGTGDNSLFLAFEGFSSHGFSSRAVPFLDRLRPHLARAISLTALHNDRAQLIVDSLSLSGASAAIVDTTGSLRAANDGFTARMAGCMTDTLTGVRFTDPFLQQQFLAALHRHAHSTRAVQSLAVRNADGGAPFAIHLLPISGAARDVCGGDGILLLIADGTNTVVPNADLLRLLFDLTPAEARLSRLIAEGKWLGQASHSLGISENTARVHLTSVFQKTGVRRQSELVSLLMGLGAPAKA